MKHKMNNNYSQVGDLNPQIKNSIIRHFFKKSIVLWMMAISIVSPSLSHAKLLYTWNDTCCVVKHFNNEKYSKLLRISTPDETDFIKADKEIRRNLFRDIMNEGKIHIKSFDESDFEIHMKFQKEFHIQLNTTSNSDNDIHQEFILSQLNWKFSEKCSDDQLNSNFKNEGKISIQQFNNQDADFDLNLNFYAQNIRSVSNDQILKSDDEIDHAIKLELNRADQ